MRSTERGTRAKTVAPQAGVDYPCRGHAVLRGDHAGATGCLAQRLLVQRRGVPGADRRGVPSWDDQNLVFPSTIGKRWHRRIFYRDYKKVVSESTLADQDSIKWHTLRHTAASQWIMQGADVFTVSRRLGHSSAAFTMDVYAHLFKGQQKVAAEALDGLLARV